MSRKMLNFMIVLYLWAFKFSCSAEHEKSLIPRAQDSMLFSYVKLLENTKIGKMM